jgi:hypothetical protein
MWTRIYKMYRKKKVYLGIRRAGLAQAVIDFLAAESISLISVCALACKLVGASLGTDAGLGARG